MMIRLKLQVQISTMAICSKGEVVVISFNGAHAFSVGVFSLPQ